MNYLNKADFIKGYLSDTDTDSLTDGGAEEVLREANAQAVAEVEGYLRGSYALPLQEPVDPLIKVIVGDLMKYRLYKRRDALNLPEGVVRAYEQAMARLKDLRAGKVQIQIAAANASDKTPASIGAPLIQNKNPHATFNTGFTQLL